MFGQPVTFTASVMSPARTPTGTVTFREGTTVLGTAPLDGSGQASFTTSGLPAGSYAITASYDGDSAFTGTTSPAVTHVVNPATTSTTLDSSPSRSSFGEDVRFFALVTSVVGRRRAM